MSIKHKSAEERFRDRIEFIPFSTCWYWTGYLATPKHLDTGGYGYFQEDKKIYRAHRYAYVKFIGPIPDGCLVCHRCDEMSCVNPEHLFVGTQQDNMDDCVAKNRNVKGEGVPWSRLTEQDVRWIRKFKNDFSQQELGRMFGVSQSNIALVVGRKTWKHI